MRRRRARRGAVAGRSVRPSSRCPRGDLLRTRTPARRRRRSVGVLLCGSPGEVGRLLRPQTDADEVGRHDGHLGTRRTRASAGPGGPIRRPSMIGAIKPRCISRCRVWTATGRQDPAAADRCQVGRSHRPPLQRSCPPGGRGHGVPDGQIDADAAPRGHGVRRVTYAQQPVDVPPTEPIHVHIQVLDVVHRRQCVDPVLNTGISSATSRRKHWTPRARSCRSAPFGPT